MPKYGHIIGTSFVAVEQLNHKHKSKWIAIQLLGANRIYNKYRDQELSSRKINFPVIPSFHLFPSFISLGTFGWIFFSLRPNGSRGVQVLKMLLTCLDVLTDTKTLNAVSVCYAHINYTISTHLFFLLPRRTRSSPFPTLCCPFPCSTLMRLFI